MLDRIQKGLPVEKEDVDRLREQKLVEGRLTSLYLSASVAKSIDESTAYIKNKGFDDKYYKDLIVEYLKQYMLTKGIVRELLLNAINHKDYATGVPIQISIYENRIVIFNMGSWSKRVPTDERVYEKHGEEAF
ncbi:MAG: hypothetical protein NC400_04860 [Clostridium sp.]|nr:hypothetical protein [Clostridium sp.]